MVFNGDKGIDFESGFKALSGLQPLSWQRRLYGEFKCGRIPLYCWIPTGLGKTSVILIWLLALVENLLSGESHSLPRRLIYIVNRRTVVDQATDIALKLREKIFDCDGQSLEEIYQLELIKKALLSICSDENEEVIGISTLRGELADNEEWKKDPARACIIIGTVDMIGSKLLFSGFGDSFRMRPHHAGLIGQDSLIIHDEAHLTPAFSQLLNYIVKEQKIGKDVRPLKVMHLSATIIERNSDTFTLMEKDLLDDFVLKRLNAKKDLYIHFVDGKKVIKEILKRSLEYKEHKKKILIYVRSPEDATTLYKELSKDFKNDENRVEILTGTLRGYERDKMIKNSNVFTRFANPNSSIEKTIYLISTSAGEVGVDLYADYMLSDATTLDSLIQRLGRVNRDGKSEGRVDLFVDQSIMQKNYENNKKDRDYRTYNTIKVLDRAKRNENGTINVGLNSLTELLKSLSLEEIKNSFASVPEIRQISDIILDTLTLTSIKDSIPERKMVSEYLHGIEPEDSESYVAWRHEVKYLTKEEIEDEIVEEWFLMCPIMTCERLRDSTERILGKLKEIEAEVKSIVINEYGNITRVKSLKELSEQDIKYCTIVLPSEVGGLLKNGVLDSSAFNKDYLESSRGPNDINEKIDVCEEFGVYRRIIVKVLGDEYCYYSLNSVPDENENVTWQKYISYRKMINEICTNEGMECVIDIDLNPENGNEEWEYLLLLKEKRDKKKNDSLFIELTEHTSTVVEKVEKIAMKLRLEENIKESLIGAAKYHDYGKNRELWQKAVGNEKYPELIVAKWDGKVMMNYLNGYRHEFGSIMDAMADESFMRMLEVDLALHLIAAHHGYARPHFLPETFDKKFDSFKNEETLYEVIRRFERLQKRFERWGLAWLECLLRCADAMASSQRDLNNSMI